MTTALYAAGEVTTKGAQNWISGNLIPLAILVVAALMLFLSRTGEIAKLVTIGAGVLIALAVAGLAANGADPAKKVGSWMVEMFVGSGDGAR